MSRIHSAFQGRQGSRFVASVFVVSAFVTGSTACSAGDDFHSSGTGGAAGGKAGTGGTSGAGKDAAGAAGSGSSGSGGAAGEKGSDPNGTSCKVGGDCATGYCVDGVCCDSACDGACKSCNSTGARGTCTATAENADPEGDCLGNGKVGDTCVGACDGKGACKMPDAQTSCGSSSCSAGNQTSFGCDGAGACAPTQTSCGLYQCGAGTCMNQCGADTDCTSDAWCNASNCEQKKDNGQSCGGANECTSATCAGGTCCNVACSAPASCSTGTCVCGTSACKAGEQCITWYADGDGDGFGDPNVTTLGCSNTGPTSGHWVKNNQDCYDKNPDAKPGQTQYFELQRGDGSYDYNCDNSETQKYPYLANLTCGDCGTKVGAACYSCGAFTGVNTYGFGCGASNKCTGAGYATGYKTDVQCGSSDYLWSCEMCSTTQLKGSAMTAQRCR